LEIVMSTVCRTFVGVGAVVAAFACAGVLRTGAAEGGGTLGHDPRVELGRRLFFDPAISRSGDNSCASCHEPDHGFSSPKKRNLDDFTRTRRHSQTLLDAADGQTFHWDGEFRSVAELVTARIGDLSRTSARTRRTGPASSYSGSPATPTPTTPFFDPEEPPPTTGEESSVDVERILGHAEAGTVAPGTGGPVSPTAVADRVEEDGRYADGFQAAFGSPRVTVARIAQAIQAYVQTIRSTDSAYDRYVAGDRLALSEPARRGLALFRGARLRDVPPHGRPPRPVHRRALPQHGRLAHAVIGPDDDRVARTPDLLAKRPGRQRSHAHRRRRAPSDADAARRRAAAAVHARRRVQEPRGRRPLLREGRDAGPEALRPHQAVQGRRSRRGRPRGVPGVAHG
jgi:hypothetical protein